MRRRNFIAGLVSTAAAWPIAARAQQPNRVRRIGVLLAYLESDHDAQSWVSAFRQELGKLGWAEGSNVHIDVRWGTADVQVVERYAKELVALQPDFILTVSTPATAVMAQQTRTIPIIFVMVGDPVGSGFVESLSRPGRNLTGFTNNQSPLIGKWMELLKEIAPTVTRAAMLFNPPTASFVAYYLNPFKAAAKSFGMDAIVAPVEDESELDSVVATQARQPNSGLIVIPDAFMVAHRAGIAMLAARYRIPAIYSFSFFAEAGGLISYGVNPLGEYQRAASYGDRILKGAKPSELPVQAPDKLQLVINLKTAKALGLDVPLFLRQRADDVIE
jgi:putative tryptophan/tyrosine transport system substrate-binding protein